MCIRDRQKLVIEDIAKQIKLGNKSICGVMLESNLVEGRQDISDKNKLVYGKSITDACIGWDETVELINLLNSALK